MVYLDIISNAKDIYIYIYINIKNKTYKDKNK